MELTFNRGTILIRGDVRIPNSTWDERSKRFRAMSLHYMDIVDYLNNSDLLKHVENSRDFVFADGALPKKFKLLIAMAFDASYGAVNGVKSLVQQALEAGAKKKKLPKH